MAIAGVGAAQPLEDLAARAKAHYVAGRQAFEAGAFAKAIAEFSAAEELQPAPTLLYNIAVAQERLGERREAVELYRRYLDADPYASNRPEVEARIAALQPRTPPAPTRESKPGVMPGMVPVLFRAGRRSQRYTVSVAGQSCTTPCELPLPPGLQQLAIGGPGVRPYEKPIQVPTAGVAVKLLHYRPAYLVAGLLVGAAATVSILSLLANRAITSTDPGFNTAMVAVSTGRLLIAMGGLVTGPIVMGMADRGSARVVDDVSELAASKPRAAPVRLVGIGVGPSPGGLSGGVTLAF